MVELLLSQGAAPSSINSQGVAPMHYAARANHAGIVRYLLQARADPLITTPEPSNGLYPYDKTLEHRRRRTRLCLGVNHLNYVCRHGHAESLNKMLGCFRAEGVAQGHLHWAIERTRTEIVEILLSTGHVDPNRKDLAGNTALCLAAERRFSAIFQLLIESGADPNGRFLWPYRNTGINLATKQDGKNHEYTALHAWASRRYA